MSHMLTRFFISFRYSFEIVRVHPEILKMKIWSVICLASAVIAETIYDFTVKNAKGEDVSLEV